MTQPNQTTGQRSQNGHPDVMRRSYRELTPGRQKWVEEIKTKGQEFFDLIQRFEGEGETVNPRHLAIARTKIEETVMWATKGVTGS